MGTEPLLPFEVARARIVSHARALPPERVALGDAAGRVLAVDLVAPTPLPPFDYSAMDGYALASTGLAAPGPWTLPVVGESRAGHEPPALTPGTTCRIFTGAPVPAGADAVVMQERVARADREATFEAAPRPGQNIRRAGEDLPAGAVAIRAGTRLHPGALALAAMLGRAELTVARRPRVAIVCTGEELRLPGDAPRAASIPESNSVALAALARQAGAHARIAPITGDDLDATARALDAALDGTDVLLTVGGVSVGDHDVVRPALERAGVTLDFWRIAIRPGKPVAVGRRGGAHVLGLPGNPSSALVTFTVLGLPLLRALQGDARPVPLGTRVALASACRRGADRLELVRATLRLADSGMPLAEVHRNQASGAATSLAASDGLAFIPAGEGDLPAGTVVDFLPWVDA